MLSYISPLGGNSKHIASSSIFSAHRDIHGADLPSADMDFEKGATANAACFLENGTLSETANSTDARAKLAALR